MNHRLSIDAAVRSVAIALAAVLVLDRAPSAASIEPRTIRKTAAELHYAGGKA